MCQKKLPKNVYTFPRVLPGKRQSEMLFVLHLKARREKMEPEIHQVKKYFGLFLTTTSFCSICFAFKKESHQTKIRNIYYLLGSKFLVNETSQSLEPK